MKEKHPKLLRNQSSWDCGKGWHPLLEDLFETLDGIIEYLPMEIKGEMYIVQIKEKFGALVVYMNQETPAITGAISLAENISYRLCEECGKPGTQRMTGWVKTLCNTHHKKREAQKNKG